MSKHYISFSAEIVPMTAEQLIAGTTGLVNKGATEINLLFSTLGGSVMHGVTIYNTLRSLPAKIITHNMGNVDSIGNVVFLAGDERYACPNSLFTFHGVGFDIVGNTRLEEKLLRERLDNITSDHRRIGRIIGNHTHLTEDDIVELFVEARTKDATWAQRIGMVNAIREPQVPQGVSVHSMVFNR